MKKFLYILFGFLLLVNIYTWGQTVSFIRGAPFPPVLSAYFQKPPVETPVFLTIPKLGVNVSIEKVGLTPEGTMDVPANPNNVGWYQFGPKPGEPGNAVIDGHVDQPGGPSVFYHLADLKSGDTFSITDTSGKTYNFVVEKTETYLDSNFPTRTVFGPSSTGRLNLITCAGKWDRVSSNYLERLVVYAKLAT